MQKRNYASGSVQSVVRSPKSVAKPVGLPTTDYGLPTNPQRHLKQERLIRAILVISSCAASAGCATPQYTIRQAPVPEESAAALQIERAISAQQAREFEAPGARPIGPNERLGGFEIQRLVERLSRVTERPSLSYRAYLVHDNDPNAAALADGRVYLTTGMLTYLSHRGSRMAELAFVLSHELAHTVAQHLVKRYRLLQQQQLLIALVSAGTAAATRNAGEGVQQAGRLVLDAASIVRDVHNSGYSQEQELEADQLGIQYVIRAGFNPQGALDLLEDFSRFENPWPFLRTHPYIALRREYLRRYLAQSGHLKTQGGGIESPGRAAVEERRQLLRDAQKLYPVGSISSQNLQREIDALENSP